MPKRKRAEIRHKTAGSPESQEGPDSAYGTQSPAVTECPFTIDYVHRPSTAIKAKKKRKRVENDSDTTPERVEGNVPSKNLEIAYFIRPGTLWAATSRYRQFILGDETFAVNDFISVNHSNVANGELITTEDEKLFWVARVLEVRAKDPENVYLRVFWCYWPDELPMGAQSYHGKHELIASNHMEVIDALTVASKATVSHWLEKDEEKVLDALYWRQTFNFQTQTLSELRKHCACQQPYNPDTTLIGCSHLDCNLWMHEQCVIEDTLKRTYERLLGTAESKKDNDTQPPSAKKGRRKSAKPKTPTHVWDGLFSATIVPREAEQGDSTTKDETDHNAATDSTNESETDIKSAGKLVITDLRKPSDNDMDKKTVWEEDIVCLGCHRTIM